MRYLILLLLPLQVLAQALPQESSSSEVICPWSVSEPIVASNFRAVYSSSEPLYWCDGVTSNCVKYGPGNKTSCGTNVAGDVICGLPLDSTGIWRFYGTVYAVTFSAVNLVATNVATVNIYQQTLAGYIDNPNGTVPVLFNDTQGTRFTCKTTLTTCGSASALEGTELKICGTGGAKTKKCECTYDGTTYAWINSYNPAAGVGTSTTCPAT